jgi:hypothetical protein|nr:MAG TPA: hypothetical protein [Caudoviricetes sp.]
MSLNKLVNKLNLNNEMFVPKIEGCNCEEGEPELLDPTKVNKTVDGIVDDLNDIEEADTIVEDVQTFLKERDPILDQDSTTKDIPLEEQIIVQEKLREVLRVTGLTLTNSLNKESLGSVESYYMNIEGLKEVMSNIGEVVKSIWDKIVEALKSLFKELGALLPTKMNRIDAAVKALEEYRNHNFTTSDIATLEYNFEQTYLDKYIAVSNLFANQDRLGYFKSMDKFANEIEGYFRNVKSGKTDDLNTILTTKNPDIQLKLSKEAQSILRSYKFLFSIKTHYKSIRASYADVYSDNEVKISTDTKDDAFKKYALDFNVGHLIHRLKVDKECLKYSQEFISKLKTTAEGISKVVDENTTKNRLSDFKGTLSKLFKVLFVDYSALSNDLISFDLATAKILLKYFKRIQR